MMLVFSYEHSDHVMSGTWGAYCSLAGLVQPGGSRRLFRSIGLGMMPWARGTNTDWVQRVSSCRHWA